MSHSLVLDGNKIDLSLTCDNEEEAKLVYEHLAALVRRLEKPAGARSRGILGAPQQRERLLADMAEHWPGISLR